MIRAMAARLDIARRVNARGRSRLWPITARAVGFGLCASLWCAWRFSEIPDEPTHLEWSRRLWAEGVSERRSNEHFESRTPITLLNLAGRRLARRVVDNDDPAVRGHLLRFASRAPTVALFAALLATVFFATRRWVGATAGHLAVMATALDPNLIAHSSVATVDVAFALFTLLSLWTFWLLAQRPSIGRALACGVSLALAFAAKFSAVLLVPGLLALLVWRPEGEPRRWRRMAVCLLVALLAATFTTCATYLFIHVGAPLGAIQWDSTPFRRAAGLLPGLRLPVPADFLTGIDLSLAHERTLQWRVVMLGREYPRGVWFYFGLLWLMKTPLLLLVAECAGCVALVRSGRWRWPVVRFLAVQLAVLLIYFSLFFRAQVGYRFVLMCVPLGYILAATGLSALPPERWPSWAGLAIVIATIAENVAYAGNALAFTNVAVQPKKDVFRWISHSNVDWRQNEDRVDEYLARAGIGRERLDPPHILPGPILLHHSHAAGNLRFSRYAWVRQNLEPVRHFDHTFLLFDVSPAEFERFVDAERRLGPTPSAQAVCGPSAAATAVGPGAPFRVPDDERERADVWTLCVDSPAGADFVWHVVSGTAVFGPVERPTRAHEAVDTGQEIWFRLAPGTYAFTIRGQHGLAATWRTARGAATATLRRVLDGQVPGG